MGAPPEITIYTSGWCGHCMRAKALLGRKGLAYREIDVDGDRVHREEMIRRSGRRTVPQIFIDDKHVGGSDDLAAAERSGELDRLLGIGVPIGAAPQADHDCHSK
jgi:glutaredoxin 3